MPTYKDANGKYYCKFYFVDYGGIRKQKKKSGFARKRDADKWEKDFLSKMAGSPDMPFTAFVYSVFLPAKKEMVRPSSYIQAEMLLRKWAVPYFKDRPLNSITPKDILQWQLDIKSQKTLRGRPMAPRTLIEIVRQVSALFNFAMCFHGLSDNPVKRTGCIAPKPEKRLSFWTFEQFQQFDSTFAPHDPNRVFYCMLFFLGIRRGELQALTPADIDFERQTVSITKTYTTAGGRGHLAQPKTEKSNRVIKAPGFLCDMIRDYMARIYDLHDNDLIFYRAEYHYMLNKHADLAGLPRIRVHDLRHSHASHLIDLGFSPLLVAERLGHDGPRTTLSTYAHLFPGRQNEVADRLQTIHEKDERPPRFTPDSLALLQKQ